MLFIRLSAYFLRFISDYLLTYSALYDIIKPWKGGEEVSKKKKSGRKIASETKINLATAIIQLITAVITLIALMKD